MQLQSARTSPPHPSPNEAIPYSSAALRQDLERVRGALEDAQSSRDRNAIYGYLTAVYDLVAWWTAQGRETDCAFRRSRPLIPTDRDHLFRSIATSAARVLMAPLDDGGDVSLLRVGQARR
jgi:hypothetical protein